MFLCELCCPVLERSQILAGGRVYYRFYRTGLTDVVHQPSWWARPTKSEGLIIEKELIIISIIVNTSTKMHMSTARLNN